MEIDNQQLGLILESLNKISSSLDNPLLVWLQFISILLLLITVYFLWKAIIETRKDRYLNHLPLLKIIVMDRRKNKRNIEYYKNNPAVQFENQEEYIKKHTEHFYISYQNIGKNAGIAFVKSVTLWEGNTKPEKKILLEGHYKNVLFPEEKEEIFYWDVNPPEGITMDMFPIKIEIIYQDIWKHNIKYTGTIKKQIAGESLPFLGIQDYISHQYEFDGKLK